MTTPFWPPAAPARVPISYISTTSNVMFLKFCTDVTLHNRNFF